MKFSATCIYENLFTDFLFSHEYISLPLSKLFSFKNFFIFSSVNFFNYFKRKKNNVFTYSVFLESRMIDNPFSEKWISVFLLASSTFLYVFDKSYELNPTNQNKLETNEYSKLLSNHFSTDMMQWFKCNIERSMTTDPCSLVLGTKYGFLVDHFDAKPFKYDLPTLKSIKS